MTGGLGARLLLPLSAVVPIAGLAVFVLLSVRPGQPFPVGILPWALFPVVWWAVGAVIVVRASGHRIGRLLVAVGILAGGLVGGVGFFDDPSLAAAPWAMLLLSAVYGPLFVALILGSMVLFPDGALPTRRWRLPVLLPIGMVLVGTVATVLRAGPFGPGLPANPIGIEALPTGLLAALYGLDPLGIALLAVVGVAAIAWRFRAGTPIAREQLKWLLASVIPVAVFTPLSFLDADQSTSSSADLLSVLGLLLVPIAIGVAVTRYRLYDIDRLISRGASWAALTALLAVVYAGGVLILQSALGDVTQGQTLAVAASTLAAAALFQPLRVRLQRAMDRRFDRARYDGDRTVAAFSERLRDQVELAEVEDDITTTIGATLHPSSTRVWIRGSVRAAPKAEVS